MGGHCCPDCFGDRGLRNDIIPSLDPVRGTCNFCGTERVDLVEPHQLNEVFQLLLGIYEPDPRGKPLVEWMKDDWNLFSHPKMDAVHAKELLGEVLNDGKIVKRDFSPSDAYKSEALSRWETLRDELMHKNRYFLNEALDTDRLKELLSYLPADNMPKQWYRARVLVGEEPYLIDAMGAPPPRLATDGRANPRGIPYLYLSSRPETAAAEVRPNAGEVACVADFTVASPLTAVDLRDPRTLVSPFILGDAGAVGQMRADIPFLERLGEELTRPILPRKAAIDYLPTQYLCEFIKKNGYGGVVYRSSVSAGMNIALFDPSQASGNAVTLFDVKSVSVDVRPKSS